MNQGKYPNHVPPLPSLQPNDVPMAYVTHGAYTNHKNSQPQQQNNFNPTSSQLQSQPSFEMPHSARTESEFYSTLRRYT